MTEGTGAAIVAAARGAVGARFRAHGRDPAHGLDCVGLAAHALRAGGCDGDVPAGYAMRGGDPRAIARALRDAGLARVETIVAGDLLLCASGPAQLHVAVAVAGGIVHADAALRRVVERPGPAPWPILSIWRMEH